MLTQKVPAGYKQTDIDIIPDDWSIDTLSKLCVDKGIIRGPFGGSLKKEIFVKSGYKVYEQRNAIYKTTILGNYYIDEDKFRELKRFEVLAGDFIISCSGTIGKIFMIPRNAPKGVINQALLILRVNETTIDKNYFYHYFIWDKFQERIIDSTQGGAMKNLVGMNVFRDTTIPYPAIKNEQSFIATVLSDIDSLIEKLDKLISKKRAIKKGTIQQLLTGKQRLLGFNGQWKVKKLGQIAEFHKGKGLTKDEISTNGKYKCIHYGELFTTYNEKIKKIVSSTNKKENLFYSCINDILMPTSDVTPNGLATASCIKKDGVILGGDILIIRVDEDTLDGIFFAYGIHQNRKQIMQLVSGSTVYHLYASDMKKYEFNIPPTIQEQKAIIEIISDMDTEINSLEAKLAKYKQIKQGAMQVLLTGKIRLVKN